LKLRLKRAECSREKMNVNRSIVLRSRPIGAPEASDFALIEQPIPAPNAESMLVQVLECSLDPAMRRWMDANSYGKPIAIDDQLPCTLIGRVVDSRCEGFNAGDLVTGRGTLSDFALLRADGYTRRIDRVGLPSLTCHLSVLGTSGLTAYNGLLKVGQPKASETVLVSAASGSVGSVVGQIAKIHGCRVVGITGGATKCLRLLESYGFDAAIDRLGKDADALARAVRSTCPLGVDVYFDNVGGPCLEAALGAINAHARIVLCGMIGEYNVERPPPGPRNLWQLVAKTAIMTGFLNREYLADTTTELAQLRRWIEEGRLKWSEHIDEGLQSFYSAFMRLFDGAHEGKVILRIAKDA
jgi:NADPH-dependent curcumin reductase CurA